MADWMLHRCRCSSSRAWSARASALLFQVRGITNELAVTVENLGNRLYAEFPNASFFRPEAERSVTAAMVIRF